MAAWVPDQNDWFPLGSGLGQTTTSVVNTIKTVGNDVYCGGLFARPWGGPNDKVNFSRWNPEMNFTGYVPSLRAPIAIHPFGAGLAVTTQFVTNKNISYKLQRSPDLKTWFDFSAPAVGFGNFSSQWQLDPSLLATLGANQHFRVQTTPAN